MHKFWDNILKMMKSSNVRAAEFSDGVASGAAIEFFVAVVTAVVLAVAEGPVGNAAVGRLAARPALSALARLALLRLVRAVAAVVVVVALPRLRDTLVVLAAEL